MRPLLTIARYDLLRATKERETFLIGLLMPVAMMILLGVAMSGGNTEGTIPIDVLDEDGSALSAQFVTLLTDEMTGDAFRLCPYVGDAPEACDLPGALVPGDWRAEADQRLEDVDTFGAVILEAGFGDRLRAGEPASVIFKRGGGLSAPTLAEQKLDAVISRLGGSVSIANLVVRAAETEFGPLDSALRSTAFDDVRGQVEAAWDARPIVVEHTSTRSRPTTVGFNQSGPGIAVMFVLIWMLNASTMLVYEREIGTLQRLYTLPHRKAQILGGKLLGQYLFGVIQFVLLVVIGKLMGVAWGNNLPAIALIVLIFTLTATALGLALATVVRTSAQANGISMLLGLTLAPLGGAWWPMEIVPEFMRRIGHISPIAWAMDAFGELMFYGGGMIDILPMLGALLGMAALFFVFGVVRFRYE